MHLPMFRQMQKQLRQLDGWLGKAIEYAATRPFDPNVLLAARLAPDQFPLSKQVQIACDTAKLSAARLTGTQAPSHADTETSLEELRARVRAVVEYLDGFTAEDFAGTPARVISLPYWNGRSMLGADFFFEYAIPNFYFHVTHVYALLRHNGVPLGKMDYLGPLTFQSA